MQENKNNLQSLTKHEKHDENITLKQVLRQHALLGCIALLPLSPVYSQADNQQIAFPGAEGWGRFATGGRTTDPAIGSKVYYVTSLDDYLSSEEPIEGTLRWALTTGDDTPRTILFKVGGTINLKERLKCPRPNVTIAGQSAPGGGICISGANIYIHSKTSSYVTSASVQETCPAVIIRH